MRFNPKTARESVKVLAGRMTRYHKATTVMRPKLPYGKLVSIDAENASVMGPHFEKVYTNHRNVAWETLIAILQRSEMIELDAEITWEDLWRAVATLKTVNHHDSATSHLRRSSHLPRRVWQPSWITWIPAGMMRPILKSGMKVVLFRYQRVGTLATLKIVEGSHSWILDR